MTDTIISLTPSMQNRLNFDHELLDHVDDWKLEKEETEPVALRYLETGSKEDRDALIMGYLWLAKDLVCRYRAHWPETICLTDDLASEAILVLTEIVEDLKTWTNQQEFFNYCQWYICQRLRDYINDNRSICAASRATNWRRLQENQPLEYNFACEFNDELYGVNMDSSYLVDVRDAIEALGDADLEEIRDRVLYYLDAEHGISEKDLSREERASLRKLVEYLRSST